MHKPSHLVALANAAQFIIEKMDYALALPDHLPGYLVVDDDFDNRLLVLNVGPVGSTCDKSLLEFASASNVELCHTRKTDDLVEGSTSSDTREGFVPRTSCAGSVAAKQLIIGYGSAGGVRNAFADEAVAIMIAIKAGLLPKSLVKLRYSNPRLKGHNPYLRLLIDTITWTS